MNFNRIPVYILVLSLFLSGCSPGQLFGPTITQTLIFTNTPTPTPISPTPPTSTWSFEVRSVDRVETFLTLRGLADLKGDVTLETEPQTSLDSGAIGIITADGELVQVTTIQAKEGREILVVRGNLQNLGEDTQSFRLADVYLLSTSNDQWTPIAVDRGSGVPNYVLEDGLQVSILAEPGTYQVVFAFVVPTDAGELQLQFIDLQPISIPPTAALADTPALTQVRGLRVPEDYPSIQRPLTLQRTGTRSPSHSEPKPKILTSGERISPYVVPTQTTQTW